jgi:hypothetical protein
MNNVIEAFELSVPLETYRFLPLIDTKIVFNLLIQDTHWKLTCLCEQVMTIRRCDKLYDFILKVQQTF